MIELDFMVPPQVMVGVGAFGNGSPVQVEVAPSPTIFPDHEQYVTLRLTTDPQPGTRARTVRVEESRVPRDEQAILGWIEREGAKVGRVLDRELYRRQKLTR